MTLTGSDGTVAPITLSVVVVDGGGHIVTVQRDDGCGTLRVRIALGKARGALGMGIPSRTIRDRLQNRPAFQSAVATAPGTKINFRFHARDLHLVLGSASGKPVRFRISLDGKVPGADAGVDVGRDGHGFVKDQRLYQLVRQRGPIRDRNFTIEFLDPDVEAFAFTFG